jgi:hypothetical protein
MRLVSRHGMIGDVAVARLLKSYVLGETAQSWLPQFDREAVRRSPSVRCLRGYGTARRILGYRTSRPTICGARPPA